MSLVANRYAQALFEVFRESGNIEQLMEELNFVAGAYEKSDDLKSFLKSRETGKAVKKDVIKRLFGSGVNPGLLGFLYLLLDKDRLGILPEVKDRVKALVDKHKNILAMKIISAAVLEKEQAERIKDKFRALYNASSVQAEISVDKSLIGGVRVIVDDKIYDGSVRAKLEGMRHSIADS